MGLRFRKSVKLIPGVRLNVGLRSASLSVGGRGVTYNIGSKGSRLTLGIPGSGLSYSTNLSQQTPAQLLSNTGNSALRFSAMSVVMAAFILGLIYIAFHSTTENGASPQAPRTSTIDRTEATGSIEQDVPGSVPEFSGPVPLPRARPKQPKDIVGPPLQIAPQ